MSDFLVRGSLAEVDPAVAEIIQHEQARQFAKLIMIASESTQSQAVREAEGSIFSNIYAEGYPHETMRTQAEPDLLDYERQLTFYRRNGDRRYYKGVEYVNVVESLAMRRGAECFCPPDMKPEALYVNVQPLSGAAANTAVYEALTQPGETVLSLDLLHGGHLSHGSPVNITGKRQRIEHYHVNAETELLDYEEIHDLAQKTKPKMIITGYTSYPFAPDFVKFRAIAESVGAYLMADVSHIAGLVAAGVVPNPVGVAHVTTFTTHKTLTGPRGAVIITTDPELAKKIDKSVFPGLQGGSHVNKIAAIATMFKLAQEPRFRALQAQIVKNAVALAEGFKANGLRVVHGGTNTHMLLLDCKTIAQHNGVPLMGNVASRILDLANIVCNRNTIPGDPDAGKPSALRFGTPWVTQRGLNEDDMREIADVLALVLKTAKPYMQQLKKSQVFTARVDFDALIEGARRIGRLAEKAAADGARAHEAYPHVWYATESRSRKADNGNRSARDVGAKSAIEVSGEAAAGFLSVVLVDDVTTLAPGEKMGSAVLWRNRVPLCPANVTNTGNGYVLIVPADVAERVTQWLRALSDGYVVFDDANVGVTIPGPVVVKEWGEAS